MVNHLKEYFPFDEFVDENAIDIIKQWYPDDDFYQDDHAVFIKNKISKIISEKKLVLKLRKYKNSISGWT